MAYDKESAYQVALDANSALSIYYGAWTCEQGVPMITLSVSSGPDSAEVNLDYADTQALINYLISVRDRQADYL